jgi:hypothetical protein
MNKRPDTLKVRADERRVQLVANLAALKTDTRPEAAAQMAKTKKQLTELQEQIKHGWQSENIEVRAKLKAWLDGNDALIAAAATPTAPEPATTA